MESAFCLCVLKSRGVLGGTEDQKQNETHDDDADDDIDHHRTGHAVFVFPAAGQVAPLFSWMRIATQSIC